MSPCGDVYDREQKVGADNRPRLMRLHLEEVTFAHIHANVESGVRIRRRRCVQGPRGNHKHPPGPESI